MAEAKDPAPAVTRAVRFLSELERAGSDPMTLTELARAVGIAKSSASNICAVLEEARLIHRTDAGYRLGMRTAELGGAYARQFNQVREFFGVVEGHPDLASQLVQVAILDGTHALYIARHEGRAERLGTPIGTRLPLVFSATGNALLMSLPDGAVDELLAAEPFRPETSRSARSAQEVREKLRAARSRGYAVDRGESFAGIHGVATPLSAWRPGDPPMAIGVALPAEEADLETVERIGRAVTEAARRLTNPLTAIAR